MTFDNVTFEWVGSSPVKMTPVMGESYQVQPMGFDLNVRYSQGKKWKDDKTDIYSYLMFVPETKKLYFCQFYINRLCDIAEFARVITTEYSYDTTLHVITEEHYSHTTMMADIRRDDFSSPYQRLFDEVFTDVPSLHNQIKVPT